MSLRLGSKEVTKLYLGTIEVLRAYRNQKLVFGRPATPEPPIAHGQGDQRVTVFWQPYQRATRYDLRWRKVKPHLLDPDFPWIEDLEVFQAPDIPPAQRPITLPRSTPGEPDIYEFSVKAYVDGTNEGSDWSPVSIATYAVRRFVDEGTAIHTAAPANAPSLTLVSRGSDFLLVAIGVVDGGENYDWSRTGNPPWTPQNNRLISLTDLDPDTDYTLYARARNSVGDGPVGSETFRTLQSDVPTLPPETPSDLTLTPSDVLVDGLIARVLDADGYEWLRGLTGDYTPIPDGGRAFRDTGLTPSTQYDYSARARNAAGASLPITGQVTTLAAPEQAPDKPEPPPVEVSGRIFTLGPWPESDRASGYRVRARQTGTEDWMVQDVENALRAIVRTMLYSTEFEFQLQAYNPTGDSPWSDSATETSEAAPVGLPAVPTGLAVEISGNNFRINWSEADRADGYRIEMTVGTTVVVIDTGENQFLTREIAAENYERDHSFRVQSYNEAGDSDWSAGVGIKPRLAVPGDVTSTRTRTSLTITIPPVRGAASFEYNYEDTDAWLAVPTGNVLSITGQEWGTEFSIRFRAKNAHGTGPASEYMTFATDSGAPTDFNITGFMILNRIQGDRYGEKLWRMDMTVSCTVPSDAIGWDYEAFRISDDRTRVDNTLLSFDGLGRVSEKIWDSTVAGSSVPVNRILFGRVRSRFAGGRNSNWSSEIITYLGYAICRQEQPRCGEDSRVSGFITGDTAAEFGDELERHFRGVQDDIADGGRDISDEGDVGGRDIGQEISDALDGNIGLDDISQEALDALTDAMSDHVGDQGGGGGGGADNEGGFTGGDPTGGNGGDTF